MLLAAFFVFFMGTVAPGDPAELQLKNRATPERIEKLREQLGLNDPLPIRYIRFIGNALQGDLGESYTYLGKSVTSLIGPRLWVSVQLNIVASVIALTIGLPLGFYAAKRQGTSRDPAIVITMLVLYAMPVFFTAPLLILFFAVQLHWVPAAGRDVLNTGHPPCADDRYSRGCDLRAAYAGEYARSDRTGVRPNRLLEGDV